jgi:hypothetical protein
VPDPPSEAWEYTSLTENAKVGPEAWRGDDHVIPWNDALSHRMHWVLVIGGTEMAF